MCIRDSFMRLSDARLQLVSLRNENSLQGFVAYWRSETEAGFHALMVVLYWIPGSPQRWAASAIRRKIARALWVPIGAPPTTAYVVQSASVSTARMKSSVTRTEWFAFWNETLP